MMSKTWTLQFLARRVWPMKKPKIGIFLSRKAGPGGSTKSIMALVAHWAKRFSVTLISQVPTDWAKLQRFFEINLSQVNLVQLRPLPSPLPSRLAHRYRQVKPLFHVATQYHYIQQMRALQLDLFVNHTPDITIPPLAKRSLYLCTFPECSPARAAPSAQATLREKLRMYSKQWLKYTLNGSKSNDVLAEYDVIAANSYFTQHWIQQRWSLPATVVYPPCELIGAGQAKEKIICHVGRFEADYPLVSVHKHQVTLLELFKRLPDLHQAGWQLHLAGGLQDAPRDRAFVQQVRDAVQNFPVILHCDASTADLHQLYRSASLYWHASGYGVDAQLHPQTQEHFGITTVEAMSAGAVPVVLNTGGQAEIVTHGVNGFVWQQLTELATYTRQLAQNENLRAALSQQAVASSQQFDTANFLAHIDVIVDQLLADQLDKHKLMSLRR